MNTQDTPWDLIADIGGTNSRFAALVNGQIVSKDSFETKGETPFGEMVGQFCADQGSNPDKCLLAFACPIRDGVAKLTNADKSVSIAQIQAASGSNDVTFINDFAAAAWAMATVENSEVTALQGPSNIPNGHRLIVGPGTGLGVGTLVYGPDGYFALAGEGGHVRVLPHTYFEQDVFHALRSQWPETVLSPNHSALEVEAVVSGTALPKLYRATASVLDQEPIAKDAAGIMGSALVAGDDAATLTVNIFKRHLGYIAGDLALITMSQGGVFLTGNIALKNQWLFDDEFLEAFRQGGRYTEARSNIPLYLYTVADFGLIGARNAITLRR